jgi:hypothetical protein
MNELSLDKMLHVTLVRVQCRFLFSGIDTQSKRHVDRVPLVLNQIEFKIQTSL